jgi:autotransporter-associated beta strand protein
LYGNWGFGYGVSTPGNGTTSYISGGNAMLAQAGAVFNVGLGDTLNVSAVLADQLWTGNPGLLVKTGSGTLLLTGSNTYTGGTTISAGTLQLGDGTSGNDGAPGTGSVTNNAALVYNLYGSQTPSYAISGSGNLIKAGPGTLTLSTNNTCTGATTVNGGVLQTSGPNTPRSTLGTSSSILVNSGGTISVGGDNSLVGYLPYGTQAIQINAGGAIVNTGSSANALSALVLNGGTLAATTPNALYGNWGFGYGVSTPGNGTTSYISGGNAVLTQGGGTVFNVGVGDTLNVSTILAHTSSGPDTGLSKTGPGLLVLTATNTYTGNTVVSAGTLVVNGAINGSSQVFAGQGSGGVLSGSGTIANQVVVQSTCGLLPGNLTGGGTLTAGSALLNPTSTVYYTLSSVAGNGSFFSVGGALDLSNLSTAAGSQATLDVLNGASLGSGTYSLIGYGSLAASWNSGVFTLAGLPAGDHYSLFETGTGLGAGTIELSVMAAATGVVHGSWSSMTSGVWTDTTKWTGGNVPGTSGSDTAVFATQPASGTSTVTLDSSRSLASLGFSSASATGYVIAASSGNTLTLAGTGSSAATISNSGGSQTINAPIVLGSNLSVAASPNSVLTIAGSIEETGNQSLSVSGGGELILSGTNSYTGGTTVNGGTLSVASAQALPTSGVLVVGRSGRVVLGNILGASEVLGASQALAATPALSSVDSSVGGRDSSPPNFAVQSSVPVAASASGSPAAVPEPGTVLLLLVGAAALAAWRRRSTASGTRG